MLGRLMRYKSRMPMRSNSVRLPLPFSDDDKLIAPNMKRMVDFWTQTDDSKRTSMSFKLTSFVCILDSGNLSTEVAHEVCESRGTSTSTSSVTVNATSEAMPTQVSKRTGAAQNRRRCDKEELKRNTGISPLVFNTLSNLLPKATQNELSREDCLLLCLIRLKFGLSCTGAEKVFGVNQPTAHQAFLRTLPILAKQTKSWIPWPPRVTVTATMHDSFKQFYPKCRVVLDIVEINIDRPADDEKAELMYSTDKMCCTVKFLIGTSPGGLITFISKAYGGKSTDGFITLDSGVLDLLEAGDMILVEKGFTRLEKSLGEKSLDLVRLEEQTGTTPGERVKAYMPKTIEKLRAFAILHSELPTQLLLSVVNIVHICSVITNLQQNNVRVQYKRKAGS